MTELTIQGIRFTRLPRGTWTGNLNPFEIDVWAFKSALGEWRWTVLNQQTGIGAGHGFAKTLEEAAEDAINFSRERLHPAYGYIDR